MFAHFLSEIDIKISKRPVPTTIQNLKAEIHSCECDEEYCNHLVHFADGLLRISTSGSDNV